MRARGMKMTFVSGDGARTPGFFDVAGAAAEGAYLSTLGVPVENLPTAKEFVEKYRRRWTRPSEGLKPFDHFGYEAAQILFDALDKVGPDPAQLIKAVRATRYEGMLGTTTFDEKGDTLNRVITMTRAQTEGRIFRVVE